MSGRQQSWYRIICSSSPIDILALEIHDILNRTHGVTAAERFTARWVEVRSTNVPEPAPPAPDQQAERPTPAPPASPYTLSATACDAGRVQINFPHGRFFICTKEEAKALAAELVIAASAADSTKPTK